MAKAIRNIFILNLLPFLLFESNLMAQFMERKPIDPTTEESYIETAKSADQYYLHENYKFALPLYFKLYKSNPIDLLINYRTGICYLNTTQKSKAIGFLEKSKEIDLKHIHTDIDFFLAQAYQAHHEFDNATGHYKSYMSTLDLKHEFNVELSHEINRLIAQCNMGKKLVANPLKVSIVHLSSKINSPYSEKNPIISFDGKTLYFSSGRPATTGLQINPKTEQYFDDIYYSLNPNSSWGPAKQLGNEINSNGNDSPLSITTEGKRLYFCRSKDENGSIFFSDRKDSSWSIATPMDKDINEIAYESGAFISYDGKSFYFSSDMEGGYGGDDLYRCMLKTDGSWGEPENLGQEINSEFDEDDPFLLKDNKTMYFSSQGHTTMGGYDIFVSKYDDRLKDWEVPSNVGYPINTAEDEISISWTGDGKTGYYSEENEEGFGNEDIYSISFKHIYPKDTTISKVAVNKPFKKSADKIVIEKNYSSKPTTGEILKEQVHFSFNESHTITEYSRNKIASVMALLSKYPDLIIEIEGFADKTDNQEYNQKVAGARANAVFKYLLKSGISKDRMQVKLYEENQPKLNKVVNPEADIKNRRVEFKIIKVKN